MRLQSITIKNFRSIRNAFRVPLSAMTVLVGQNNAGKSNVLRALVIALRTVLEVKPARPRRIHGPPQDDVYDWERDYPIDIQDAEPTGVSEFLLDFSLSPDEEEELRKEVGSRVKGSLPIELRIGPGGPTISVRKRGPGSKKVTQKRAEISRFLAARVDFDYIPAVRTADESAQVVSALVGRALAVLEDDPNYLALLQKVRELQRPILQKVETAVAESLRQFLPTVRAVSIDVAEARRADAFRRTEIVVDDGTATELRYKGDGVQSLATIALLRFAAAEQRGKKDVILVVEEPESHLHPAAIRELQQALRGLASTQQVVVSTHCGLFVDREKVGHNVIVAGGLAKPAKRLDDIRKVLGIRAADNLQHAELVLVVEGEDDRISLNALLRHRSPLLASALAGNRLAIDSLAGAANLAYKLGLLRNGLSNYIVFLDDDSAGRQAHDKALKERLIDNGNVLWARMSHLEETEFEDFLDDTLVQKQLAQKHAVQSLSVAPAVQKKKWSDRIREAFRIAGKPWDDAVEAQIKVDVAHAVEANPAIALRAATSGPIDNLVKVLEARMTVNP